jgi:hypothetical protein
MYATVQTAFGFGDNFYLMQRLMEGLGAVEGPYADKRANRLKGLPVGLRQQKSLAGAM